jgi:replication factor A1
MTDYITTTQAANSRSGINVAGQIKSIGDTRTVNLKSGGTIDTCTAILQDDAGSIGLTLWGEDIALVKVGSLVKIHNGYTNTFKDEISLTKGKFGTIEVVDN